MPNHNSRGLVIRPPAVAGAFYPDQPEALKEMIEEYLHRAVVEKLKTAPRAIIVPHAGYVYSGPVAAYAFKLLNNYPYENVILVGPSHHFSFENAISFPPGCWQTPLGKMEIITKDEFPKLKDKKEIAESATEHQIEHCLEVQLPFLQTVLDNFHIFPLLTGNPVDCEKISKDLLSLDNEKTLFVISSDLSHYLPYAEAKMADQATIDAILSGDIQRFCQYGDACGKIPIEILLRMSLRKKWQSKLLCAMNSGETGGGKEQVVGYASFVFYNQ